jgi:hypothetical protein
VKAPGKNLLSFLLSLFFRPWRWRRYIPLKRQLTLNGLHGIISQKMVLFITTAVRTSDPTEFVCICIIMFSLQEMREINTYREGHVHLPACRFQQWNYSMELNEMWFLMSTPSLHKYFIVSDWLNIHPLLHKKLKSDYQFSKKRLTIKFIGVSHKI